MNKKTSAIGLLLVFMLCLSASCASGSSAPASKPFRLNGVYGREITLCWLPTKWDSSKNMA